MRRSHRFRARRPWKRYSILPGFGPALGFTLFYLSVIALIPLAALFLEASGLGWGGLWREVTAPRARAAYALSVGASLAAAAINAVFGLIVAWVLVRYRFAGRRLLDALVDLPFALPTAVSGIALTTLLTENGWIGRFLGPLEIRVAYTRIGIVVALVFIGLPFAVRTLQPAIEELSSELEEAAATLGAGRWYTFRTVLFPALLPAFVTGFAMAFARALGEYGSVIFIAGNLPKRTEILPLLIVIKLEQYDYEGAAALGVGMLVLSFALLLVINLVQLWGHRRASAGA